MLSRHISWLSVLNKQLKEGYCKVRFILIAMPFLLICLDIFWVILILNFDKTLKYIPNRSILPILGISITIIISIFFKKICYPIINKYVAVYRRALTISNQIVDEADWTNFRKRELWNNRRIQVTNTIEYFYSIRNKRFFPCYTIRSYYPTINKILRSATSLYFIGVFCIFMFSLTPDFYNSIKELLIKILLFLVDL